MPAPLNAPTTPIKVRVYTSDLALLNTLRPREVNAVIRELVRAYCTQLRARQVQG